MMAIAHMASDHVNLFFLFCGYLSVTQHVAHGGRRSRMINQLIAGGNVLVVYYLVK